MSEQVLIIDDDVRLVSALQIRLEEAGFRVHAANSGEDGLAVAALFQPHAIILDIRMPQMDGFDVCRLLRSVPELVDIPIVILSANVDSTITQGILEAGGNTFVRKPYHLPHLLTVLRYAIDLRGKKRRSA